MNLVQCILTANDCYKTGRYITPKGVMVHSTGANNPSVARYAQPLESDSNYQAIIDKIGFNRNHNDWNCSGTSACVHGFIGKFADGSVGTVQALPWNMRGWHAGTGTSGYSANNTHISFEICEDGLEDSDYFNKVYKEAVELTAMLCKTYGLDPAKDGVVICHSEGYSRGVASNHSDVMHWFPKHGKSMDTFRADVKAQMSGGSVAPPVPEQPVTPTKSVEEIAKEVVAGQWGNGTDRKAKLEAAGYDYDEVQAKVNELLGTSTSTPAPAPTKTIDQLAQEVIAGKWGSGTDRKNKLQEAGYDYNAVQNRVNELLGAGIPAPTPAKSIEQVAREVVQGKWGNGTDRKAKLEQAGYNYSQVQAKVNELLS